MERRVREHVPALTGVLSGISLALVFGAVLQIFPPETIPRAPAWILDAIPHVNALLSLLVIGTITAGWRYARRSEFKRHRASMLTSLALFVTFLALYLYKVTLSGPAPFPGPDLVYRFGYLPLLALTRPVSALRNTVHRRVGRVAASLWIVSFALGVVVYALLYLVY